MFAPASTLVICVALPSLSATFNAPASADNCTALSPSPRVTLFFAVTLSTSMSFAKPYVNVLPLRFTAKFLSASKVISSPAPIAADVAPFSVRSVIVVFRLFAFANHFALLIAVATFSTVATLFLSSSAKVTLPLLSPLSTAGVIEPVFTVTPFSSTVKVSVFADLTAIVMSRIVLSCSFVLPVIVIPLPLLKRTSSK